MQIHNYLIHTSILHLELQTHIAKTHGGQVAGTKSVAFVARTARGAALYAAYNVGRAAPALLEAPPAGCTPASPNCVAFVARTARGAALPHCTPLTTLGAQLRRRSRRRLPSPSPCTPLSWKEMHVHNSSTPLPAEHPAKNKWNCVFNVFVFASPTDSPTFLYCPNHPGLI